jgi:hypothetical protein
MWFSAVWSYCVSSRRIFVILVMAGASTALTPPAEATERTRIGPRLPAALPDRGADIPELRTRRSRTFEALHGSYTTEVFAESVNYKDDSGRWRPIDNTLVPDGGVIRNRANRYDFRIPRAIGNSPVRVSYDNAWIEFAPRGAAGAVQIDGAVARIPDAWPGAELRWTATGDGVREEILLSGPGAVRDFTFDVRLPVGFTPSEARNGAVVVHDAAQRARLHLSPTMLIDAAGAIGAAPATLERTLSGWYVKVTPDRRWLSSRARRWPVTVDPTVVVDTSLACTISTDPTYNGCGGGWTMVGEDVCSQTCESFRALLKFDIGAAVPADAMVEFANLSLDVSATSPVTLPHVVTAPWTPQADWQTRDGSVPWSGPGAEGDTSAILDPGTMTWVVRGWAAGQPNNGLLLKAAGRDRNQLVDVWSARLDIQYAPIELPNGSTQLTAIDAYVSETGITGEEAGRRLRIQDRFNNLRTDLQDAIAPGDYGGAWVDDVSGGRIRIGIESSLPQPPQSKTAAAQEILDAHNVTFADFVSVASSIEDLEAAGDALEADVRSLSEAGKVLIGIRESANAVSVERVASLTAQEAATLDAAIDRLTVAVEEEVVNDANLFGTSAQDQRTCGTAFFEWLVCDTPFRGGTRIENAANNRRCTGGFLANSQSDGVLYLITAGHCFTHEESCEVNTANWYTHDKTTGTRFIIGRPHRGTTGCGTGRSLDAGIIRVNPPGTGDSSPMWTTSSNRYVFVTRSSNPAADTTRDEFYEIERVRRPTEGSVYCMTGAREFTTGRHTVCGRVKKTSTKVRPNAAPLSLRYQLIRIDMCGPSPGSSGGPLYKNHTGYGIFVLFKDGTCRKYFTRLDAIQRGYNVDVVP